MPLPMPRATPRTPGGISPAASDLGLGTMLADQVAGETEEERKKRMAQMQQRNAASGMGGGSSAVMSLFGSLGGMGGTGY